MDDKPPWEETSDAPQLEALKPWEEAQHKSQLSQEAAKLPPSEEPWEMQFARGVASGGEDILRAGTQLLPGPETKALATPTEGEVTGGKVKEGRHTEATPISVLGSMAPTGAIAGAAAKTLPKAAGALARGAVGGAVGGAVQPVEGGDFWTTKAEQVATGVGLGFGFSLAGQVVTPPAASLMRWIGRKFNPETLEDGAVSEVLGRINSAQKYGGPSATDMLDLISKSKKPLTLADVGGAPVQGLAGRAYRSGPGGKQVASGFLEARDEGAYARLLMDVGTHINSGPAMYDAIEGLNIAQKAAAAPMYAETDKLQNIWSPRLQQFLQNKEVDYVRKGLRLGYELEAADALAENRAFNATMMGVDLDAQGEIKLHKVPNMRVLDMGKRGMDAMVAAERQPDGRLTARGRSIAKVRSAYIQELDALDTTGAYKKARETWGGYQSAKDAIHFGRAVFGNMSPEEIQAEFSGMSKGDQEYARLGMADMLRERVAKTGFNQDESAKLIKDQWMKRQMRPFFKSPEDYDQFVDKVMDERMMKQTMSTVMRGSQTQERAVEDNNTARPLMWSAAKIGWSAAHGNILRGAKEAWQFYHDFAKGKADPEFDTEVAKIVFAPDLMKTPPGVRFMQKVAEMELAKAAKGGAQIGPPAPGIIPGALGGAAAEQMAPRQDILGSQ